MRGNQRGGHQYQHQHPHPERGGGGGEDRRRRSRSRSRDRDRDRGRDRDRDWDRGRISATSWSEPQPPLPPSVPASGAGNSGGGGVDYRDRGRADRGDRSGSRRDDYDHHSGQGDGGYSNSNSNSRRRYDNYEDSSDWSRVRDRDRDRDRDGSWKRGRDRGGERHGNMSEPTNTVIIKGLPTHTTEPSLYAVLANFAPQNIRLICERGSYECKGYAFVEFFSTEYAEHFTKSFTGSIGDQNGPQLIVEGRAVTMDYATPRSDLDHCNSTTSESSRRGDMSSKSDWLCDTCGCQNFARRDKCYRCSALRTNTSARVTANLAVDPFGDVNIVASAPSNTLAVRGLPLFCNEEQISEMFRQYAMVQNVSLLRDPQSNMSRGIAFVEFLSIDHATHTLNCYNQSLQNTSTSSQPLQVSYAKESFLKGLPALQLQQQQLHNVMVAPLPFSTQSNPNQTRSSSTTASGASSLDVQKAYARAALEAAQWSAGTTAPNANILSSSNAGTKQYPVALSYTTPSYFETHGASYIFQPKSGIFYDAATKFYYCPKSKLYYSEVDGRYLYAVSSDKKSGKNSPAAPPGLDFLEFVPPIPSSAPVENSIAVKQEATDQLPVTRRPVKMSLGGLSKKNGPKAKIGVSSITNAVSAVLPSTAKQINQDIAKWSEIKTADEEVPADKSVVKRDNVSVPAIPGKATPTFVCTLCRRQFASNEQLLRHNRESKLHASNLAKANLTAGSIDNVAGSVTLENVDNASSIGPYRDRASERRAVHGQSAPDATSLIPSKSDWVCDKCKCENFARRLSCFRCSAPISIAFGGAVDKDNDKRQLHDVTSFDIDNKDKSTSNPSTSCLDDDVGNPGNQMLRRLGWKAGEGLGRDGSGDVETVAEKLELKSAPGGTSSVKSGVGVKGAAIPPIDYGARSRDAGSAYAGSAKGEYKTSIMRAAKARYDQLDQQK